MQRQRWRGVRANHRLAMAVLRKTAALDRVPNPESKHVPSDNFSLQLEVVSH
jgi:hypothetical protein